jgi:hypothetical protein
MKRAVPLLLLLLSSTAALADQPGMEPRNWVARRLSATGHVQLEVARVEAADGACRVEGKVGRVFKGKAAEGETLAFRLPCGAEAFWTAERLRSAKWLEVFLADGLKGAEAADDGQGLKALDGATATPQVVDDPTLVREMSESIARYQIDAETKQRNGDAALALTRVDDPVLHARLLADAAGLMTARGLKGAAEAADQAVAAVTALADPDIRLETGLDALESLAMGQAAKGAVALAAFLEPQVDALTLPSKRDAATLVLYGARIRSADAAGAFLSLSKLSDPATRRDRLANMPFAQKEFSPVNPDSPAWLDRLLTGAEALPPGEFRTEALTQLCRTTQRAAMELTRLPNLLDKAAVMAAVAARHHHAPSAQLLALIKEAQGGKDARAEAARWHAVSASGFDGGDQMRAEAIKALATFTAAERSAAARLIQPTAKGAVSPEQLIALAGK